MAKCCSNIFLNGLIQTPPDITPPVEPVLLPFSITFDDIANASFYVADINSVDDWNSFIGASTGFASVVINGNTVELYGDGEKALLNAFLFGDSFIIGIDDQSLTITEIPAFFASNTSGYSSPIGV